LLRHPAQLYEMLFHLCFAIVAAVATGGRNNPKRLRSFRGDWMPLYLIAYSIFRFISEYWRPENRDSIGFTFYQWSSVAIAFGFMFLLLNRWFRERGKPD
jgi:prolipoprotein diacylglyceryltransferase